MGARVLDRAVVPSLFRLGRRWVTATVLERATLILEVLLKARVGRSDSLWIFVEPAALLEHLSDAFDSTPPVLEAFRHVLLIMSQHSVNLSLPEARAWEFFEGFAPVE